MLTANVLLILIIYQLLKKAESGLSRCEVMMDELQAVLSGSSVSSSDSIVIDSGVNKG